MPEKYAKQKQNGKPWLFWVVVVFLLLFIINNSLKEADVLGWPSRGQTEGRTPLSLKLKSRISNILKRGSTPAPTSPGKIKTTPTPTMRPPADATLGANPFGVMLGPQKAGFASKLGVAYYRPTSLFVSTWNGKCAECDTVLKQGIKLILTVRNNGGQKNATTPPTDLEAYKRTLTSMLNTYKTEVLVVENEENSMELFYKGTPQQYHAQLKAACDVAHSKGIRCTNGGIVSSLVALLVANSYSEKGQSDKASEYLARALGPKLQQEYGLRDPKQLLNNPKAKSQIERGKALLSGYKQAGADYMNFHWYIADTKALEEAVAYLKEATGLPVMANEIGQQKNEDPAQVTSVMQKFVDLRLPYVIWFSIDIEGYGGARGLMDQNGNLRPNGQAFKDFIDKTF